MGHGYKIYNELIQHNKDMRGSFDVLEAFFRICHESGIQLHLKASELLCSPFPVNTLSVI